MNAVGEWDEFEEVVAQILSHFDLEVPRRRAWRRTLADLRRVLRTDYEESVAAYVAAGEFPVDELQRVVREHFPDFNRKPLEFPATLQRARDRDRGLGLNVKMSPFGPQGHPLRGFYHRPERKRPIIWLNCQHTETAVGATLAHELGHHFWAQIAASDEPTTRTLHHDGFAGHVDDPRELFADVFPAIGGYPQTAARRLFVRAKWWQPQMRDASGARNAVARIERHVHGHYPGDLGGRGGLSNGLRLYYLGSLLHFSKLRAAILRVAGC